METQLKINKPFEHRTGAHCESSAMSSLLYNYGYNISEPMVFGLSASLNFAYLPIMKMNGMPMISYRMPPGSILKGSQKRLGYKLVLKKYSSKEKAMDELTELVTNGQAVGLQTSAYWLPYFPPEMRFQFNAHNLIIYGKEGNEFLVSDPIIDEVRRISHQDLENARFARGTLAPKGFMYYPIFIPENIDIAKHAGKAIKRNALMLTSAPIPFGVRGIKLLANKIENLEKFDSRYIKHFLGHIVRMQEEIGTGGAGFRFLYSAFLKEAYDLLQIDELKHASLELTKAGDKWRIFALHCAKCCKKNNDVFNLKEIADLLKECSDLEKTIFIKLKILKL
jgi:hypothetical protein